MRFPSQVAFWALGILLYVVTGDARAQDWPQWRGVNRDAKAAFKAPESWPTALAQKWKVPVGEGVATPALLGERLYVFSRLDGKETLYCLDAASGKEIWKDQYESPGATGPASSFSGPRSSPAVAEGKIVALGVRGTLSCLEAATGKVLWRKDDFKGAVPRFFTSSSPIIIDGMCIAQLGGGDNGALIAYDLASGEQKWTWTGDSPAYASPVLMMIDGMRLIIAETERRIAAIRLADGKQVWETPFAMEQGMRGYNASTPVVDGQVLIFSGSSRGTRAIRFEKDGDGVAVKEIWRNPDQSVQFNTPVVKEGLLYGLSQSNELFCLDKQTGKTAWTVSVGPADAGGPGMGGPGGMGGQGRRERGGRDGTAREGDRGATNRPSDAERSAASQPREGPPGGREGMGPGGGREGRGRGPGMGGRGGGSRGGYGSIVDAGTVLLALTPASQLIVFAPGDKQYTERAKIKVADTPTYAYPVASGSRLFIKDQDSLTLWTVD
ncbi:MAG: PQQ-like beta-propeller repeat protein [Phycisphaerae bacterium]|nr:PQQ-like beta-propeller repeat protein [Phycisphaerae bacterium]